MSKGQATRQSILEHATCLASKIGLEGLSIGKLAEALNLSKSGLFAHFRSKEALQIQVMEHAAERFVETVIKPALKAATVAKPVGGQLDAVVADPLTPPQPHAPLALGSPQSEKTLADARALAKQNPAAVAHIVRDWVSKDAG